MIALVPDWLRDPNGVPVTDATILENVDAAPKTVAAMLVTRWQRDQAVFRHEHGLVRPRKPRRR